MSHGRSMKKPDDEFSEKEMKARFEAALKSALNTPHKPLKEKPKVKRVAKKAKKVKRAPPGT
jgi:hypothetical protein